MKTDDRSANLESFKPSTVRLGVLLKRLRLSWRTYKTLKQEGRWMPEIRANARVVMIEETDVEAWKSREKERTASLHVDRKSSIPSPSQSSEGDDLVSPKVAIVPLGHGYAASAPVGYGQ